MGLRVWAQDQDKVSLLPKSQSSLAVPSWLRGRPPHARRPARLDLSPFCLLDEKCQGEPPTGNVKPEECLCPHINRDLGKTPWLLAEGLAPCYELLVHHFI